MDLRKLKTLIDLVSESNVSELEITEAEGKVRIVKGGTAMVQQFVQAAAPVVAQPQAVAPDRLRLSSGPRLKHPVGSKVPESRLAALLRVDQVLQADPVLGLQASLGKQG